MDASSHDDAALFHHLMDSDDVDEVVLSFLSQRRTRSDASSSQHNDTGAAFPVHYAGGGADVVGSQRRLLMAPTKTLENDELQNVTMEDNSRHRSPSRQVLSAAVLTGRRSLRPPTPERAPSLNSNDSFSSTYSYSYTSSTLSSSDTSTKEIGRRERVLLSQPVRTFLSKPAAAARTGPHLDFNGTGASAVLSTNHFKKLLLAAPAIPQIQAITSQPVIAATVSNSQAERAPVVPPPKAKTRCFC